MFLTNNKLFKFCFTTASEEKKNDNIDEAKHISKIK